MEQFFNDNGKLKEDFLDIPWQTAIYRGFQSIADWYIAVFSICLALYLASLKYITCFFLKMVTSPSNDPVGDHNSHANPRDEIDFVRNLIRRLRERFESRHGPAAEALGAEDSYEEEDEDEGVEDEASESLAEEETEN